MIYASSSSIRFSDDASAEADSGGALDEESQKRAAAGAREILIIEDSPTVRLYLKKIIEYAFPFARIHEADDGRAALQSLTRGSVQLIISDLNMPRMDGRLFVQTLRKSSILRRKPVLLLSSEKPEDPEFAGDPLVSFLLKPSDPDTIVKAAKELLAKAATQNF